MPNLAPTDWLIVLLALVCALVIGVLLRSNVKTSKDFLQAGRRLPAWICAVAFIAAGLGSQEVIAMGAAGARYGFRAALYFSLGAIPAMLFAGVCMMPLYYGSGARTAPEYLRLRFDRKTRLLTALAFVAMSLVSAGISLYLMARLFQTLRIFDPLFFSYGWPRQGIFPFCIFLFSAVALVYVLFAGLAGAMVNQALQFLLIVAAFLPMVLMGLKNIGSWSGLMAALPAAVPHSSYVFGAGPTLLLSLSLGFVLSAGRWPTDFRILQAAMAAKNIESARRVPLFAAAVRLLLPFLLILPGTVAIGLPTPQSTTVIRNENGVIYHEITVVPREVAEGQGLVPARLDPATRNPLQDAAGKTQLNYDRSTPNMLMHFLPAGLLGLGVAALLASLTSGLAASVTAVNAAFTVDIYQSCIRKEAGDSHYLAVSRWAAVGAILLSIGVAMACSGFNLALDNILYPLLLLISLVSAPQLATYLLGMFSKRITGHGAFAGLVVGMAAAILHHGLTLSADAQPGLYGGWIAPAHRYHGFMAQCLVTTILALAVNVAIASAVSLFTKAKPEAELAGLVHSLTPRPAIVLWWKRPEVTAAAILLAALALALVFV